MEPSTERLLRLHLRLRLVKPSFFFGVWSLFAITALFALAAAFLLPPVDRWLQNHPPTTSHVRRTQ